MVKYTSIDSLGLGGGYLISAVLVFEIRSINSALFVTVAYNGRSGGGNKLSNLT